MKIVVLFLCILILLIFRNWFISPDIIGGDWPYLFEEQIQEVSFIPSLWDPIRGSGMGGVVPTYPLQLYFNSTAYLFVHLLHIPWNIVQRIVWFGMFVFLSVFSSMYMLKKIFPNATDWQKILAALVYTTNTYALMIVGGGQMGVALAYSIVPLVLMRFVKVIDEFKLESKNFQFSIFNSQLVAGLVLALQVLFDPRIAYVTMVIVLLYVLWTVQYIALKHVMQNFLKVLFYVFLIPMGMSILLLAFWLLPLFLFHINPAPASYISPISSGILKFFSFGTFSQSLSLLHPNWPENIFGKSYFMKGEFILLPIIAYSSLLFRNSPSSTPVKQATSSLRSSGPSLQKRGRNNNKSILFFALLGLLGAFLSKGASEPFGGVYIWFFENIPGFSLFRDPTKWYVLVAVSYAVLIPYSLWKISKQIQSYFTPLIVLLGISYWLFIISPALLGQLGGTFRIRSVPQEYVALKDFLHTQPDYFRTFWVPSYQRLGFYSNNHPAINAADFLQERSQSKMIRWFKTSSAERVLQEASVKYVIVPFDVDTEIFLRDRRYDIVQYQAVVSSLENIAWLRKEKEFGKIIVFSVSEPKGHFWLANSAGGSIVSEMIKPTHYKGKVIFNRVERRVKKLVFSEQYDQNWYVKVGSAVIYSKPYNKRFNSFSLPADYNGETVDIYYQPQAYIYAGLAISALVLFGIGMYCIKIRL